MAKFTAKAAMGHESPTDEFETGGKRFAPYLGFRKGSPQMKGGSDIAYRGGFYIAYDSAPKDAEGNMVDLEDYGWEDTSFINGEDEEIQCFYRHDVRVAPITMRSGIHVYDYGVLPRSTKWADAQKFGSPSGIINVLVAIEGLEEFGPYILSLRGHTQMAFQGAASYKGVGVQQAFRNTIVKEANSVTKSSNPYYQFWMRLRASTDKKGAPLFYTAGKPPKSTKVVVPELFGMAEDIKNDDYYVGPDNAVAFKEIRESAAEWIREWDVAQVQAKPEDKPKEDDPFNDDDDELAGML